MHRTTVIMTDSGDLIVTVFSSLAISETCGLLKEYTTVNLSLAFHRRHPSSPPYWLFLFVLLLWQLALASRWIRVKKKTKKPRLDEIPKFCVTMFTVFFILIRKKFAKKKPFAVKRCLLKRRTNYNKTDNTKRCFTWHKRRRWKLNLKLQN